MRTQLLGEQAQGLFYQRQFVGRIHAAGHIHQKHQIGRRQFFKRQILRFNADFDDLGVRLPRRIDGIGVHRKRRAALRQRIAVVEIVNQFFHPHRIHRRQAAIVKEAAAVGIAAGVDINAEGGHRLLRHGMHRVGVDLAVLLSVLDRQPDFGSRGRRHYRSWHGSGFGGMKAATQVFFGMYSIATCAGVLMRAAAFEIGSA